MSAKMYEVAVWVHDPPVAGAAGPPNSLGQKIYNWGVGGTVSCPTCLGIRLTAIVFSCYGARERNGSPPGPELDPEEAHQAARDDLDQASVANVDLAVTGHLRLECEIAVFDLGIDPDHLAL